MGKDRTAYFRARYLSLTEEQKEKRRERARRFAASHKKKYKSIRFPTIQTSIPYIKLTTGNRHPFSGWFNKTMIGSNVII
jgi:hypothetical protein